jgi:Kef-type K+ transport system membrane component KefB
MSSCCWRTWPIIIILARLLGIAAKRLGQPPVLGEILAGILLGPMFFHGTITKALFPASLISPLTALADIGLVLFMFVVGYEVDSSATRHGRPLTLLNTAARAARPSPRGVSGRPAGPPNMREPGA